MGLPWHKTPNSDVLAGMGADDYPPGWRVPRWLAMVEARAVISAGVEASWTCRKLAARWGWGKSQASEVLKAVRDELGLTGQNRTATGQAPDKTGHEIPSERLREPDDRTKPDSDRTSAGHLARARSIRGDQMQDAEETPPPPPPPSRGESVGTQQQGNSEQRATTPNVGEPPQPMKPPHVPNFDKPTTLPPPEQLADRDAFVARWNLHAEAFYPGQPSQRWEATTLAARRGHGARGFFTSAKEDAKEQPMLEHGDHLIPMLDRYAAVCRGEFGERRPFERRDFEAPRMLAALRLWVTTGTAPFWARSAGQPEPLRVAGPAVELLDNDWLRDAARAEGGGT